MIMNEVKTDKMEDICHHPQKFATTVRLQANPCYANRAKVLPIPDMLPTSKYRLVDEWRIFSAVIGALFRDDVLLINACRGRFKPELMATILAGFLPKTRRPKIVLYGDMFQPSGDFRYQVERLLMWLADRATQRYVLLTEAEREAFSHIWDIDKGKVEVCPYYLAPGRHTATTPNVDGQHIFAGGNSFRNYNPLIEAARELPQYQFILCTPLLDGRRDLPANVRAGLVSRQEYVQLIDTAAAVVIPLQTGLKRIAGLQTCFDSMWLKKPTIISDALGINEYVENGRTGLVVAGSPQSYVDSIEWVMDPNNRQSIETMCEAAHKTIKEQYTLANHVHHLLTIMNEVMT